MSKEPSTWRVIPLLLRSVEIPTRLRILTSLDARDQKNWCSVIKRLVETLGGSAPGPAEKIDDPYPGLQAFSEDQSHLFFGREKVKEHLFNVLVTQHNQDTRAFLALIGRSGSGKSSLVHAGIVPSLRKSNNFGSGEWYVHRIRLGTDPLKAFLTSLVETFLYRMMRFACYSTSN